MEITDYDVEVVEVMILFMYGKTTGLLEDPAKYWESKTPAAIPDVTLPEVPQEEKPTDTASSEIVDDTTVAAPDTTYTSPWGNDDPTSNDLVDPTITATATTSEGFGSRDVPAIATTTKTTTETKPSRQSSPSHEQALETILGLIGINSVADYYDVLGLRLCTQLEIRCLFLSNWSPVNFLAAAKVVSSSTGDTALHHMFIKLAAMKMGSLLAHSDKFDGITALKDFGPKLMEYTHKRMETMSNQLELLDLFAGNMISEFNRPFYRNYRHATVAEIVDKMAAKRSKLAQKI